MRKYAKIIGTRSVSYSSYNLENEVTHFEKTARLSIDLEGQGHILIARKNCWNFCLKHATINFQIIMSSRDTVYNPDTIKLGFW